VWKSFYNNGSQTFDEDWWTMLIEFGTEWTLNQSDEFKVMNSLSTPRPKIRMNTVDSLSHASTSKRMGTSVFFSGDQATFVASGGSSLQKYPNVANPHLLQH
jgi:hypothetical protein